MKLILNRIFSGALNGFPLIRTIIQLRKKEANTPVLNITTTNDNLKPKQNVKIDYLAVFGELITVILIIAFVLGKITITDIKNIISIVK